MDKFYKTGEVAKLANLTIRTIRYYDQIDLLKPSKIDDNGYRLYTPSDLIKDYLFKTDGFFFGEY